MWTIDPSPGTPRALAVGAYLAAGLAFLLAQEIGLRLRDEEQRAWWAGNGRDLLNAAGLVAITPAAGFVAPVGALVIGLAAGFVCFLASTQLKRQLGYDDSLDVFGIHGVGGILGAILTGVFAVEAIGGAKGLLEGNPGQVWTQIYGIAATIVWCAVATFASSSSVRHSGFSTNTCLPARSAATTCSACRWCRVPMNTAWIAGSSSRRRASVPAHRKPAICAALAPVRFTTPTRSTPWAFSTGSNTPRA